MNKLKLAEADQERYGGPEVLDPAAAILWVHDLDYDGLKALEDEVEPAFGMTLIHWLVEESDRSTLVGFRGRAWLALKHAGVDVALAGFKPDVLKMRRVVDAADAVPPSGGAESSPGSTSTAEPGPPSQPSTEASAPGHGAPTE